jgi:hypothetical protein
VYYIFGVFLYTGIMPKEQLRLALDPDEIDTEEDPVTVATYRRILDARTVLEVSAAFRGERILPRRAGFRERQRKRA